MKLLTPPLFPPWEVCRECREQLAVTIRDLQWCTSAQCDPRGNTLRAIERYFQQHPAQQHPAAEPANSKPGADQ